MRPPAPVHVVHLFPVERAALLDVLRQLRPTDWTRPTIAGDWTVKDIAAHLVGDDLGRLSSQRDRFVAPSQPSESAKALVDRRNAEWVVAARRLSPAVVLSLLEHFGRELHRFLESLDPFAVAGPVSWAGPDPAPVWLDVARELTERWHHQQQIRDAVGVPTLTNTTLLGPVLATFAFALPRALDDTAARDGTAVHLGVVGPAGGDWAVVFKDERWRLWADRPSDPAASVTLDEDSAWRMYVRAISDADLRTRARIEGDQVLGERVLRAFALVS